MMGRIAFCLTMLYIAGTGSKVHRWAKFVTATFIVLQVIVNLLAFVIFYAQCGTHLEVFWVPEKMMQVPKYCMDTKIQTDLGYFQGAFNCLTDAYLTFLPALLIEHTKLSIKKKFGLVCLLCLSIVALAASIGKTYEAKALSQVSDFTCKSPEIPGDGSTLTLRRRGLVSVHHLDRDRTQRRHRRLVHPSPASARQPLRQETAPSPGRELAGLGHHHLQLRILEEVAS